jgi:hypothetical protein
MNYNVFIRSELLNYIEKQPKKADFSSFTSMLSSNKESDIRYLNDHVMHHNCILYTRLVNLYYRYFLEQL